MLIKGCDVLTIVESESEIPVGCVGENISNDLAAHLLLKGVVNVDQEIAKAEKKKAFQEAAAEKLRQGMQAPGYEEKKPLQVREKESQKVRCFFRLFLPSVRLFLPS